MSRRITAWLLACAAFGAAQSSAGTISLKWDPIAHANLAGYQVYWGTTPGNFASQAAVGLETRFTLTGIAPCTTYFAAVKARTGTGTLSAQFSNVVSGWARPELVEATPASANAGTTATLRVAGANFRPGARVLFLDPAVTVLATRVESCSVLSVDVRVAPGTPPGDRAFEVIQSDGVFGSASGLFAVTEPPVDEPLLSEIRATGIGSTTATITWTTTDPAEGSVFVLEPGTSYYHEWPETGALRRDHSVLLHGLRPDTEYRFHVRGIDAEGETTSPDSTFRTTPNAFHYVRAEAEAGVVTAPLVEQGGTSAFGGAWVEATTAGSVESPSGMHGLDVFVPADGEWRIWFRMRGAGPGNEGWSVRIDGGAVGTAHNSQAGVWEWLEAGRFSLSAGLHNVELFGLGAGARVDRLLLTDDPGFLPGERPTGNLVPPDPVNDLVATAGNGEVALTWTAPATGDFRTAVVRYRDDGAIPGHPADGWPVTTVSGLPGLLQGTTHSGVPNGGRLIYAVFAVDVAGNASEAAVAEAVPAAPLPLPKVTGLRRTDTKD